MNHQWAASIIEREMAMIDQHWIPDDAQRCEACGYPVLYHDDGECPTSAGMPLYEIRRATRFLRLVSRELKRLMHESERQ